MDPGSFALVILLWSSKLIWLLVILLWSSKLIWFAPKGDRGAASTLPSCVGAGDSSCEFLSLIVSLRLS